MNDCLICKDNLKHKYVYMTANNLNASGQNKHYHIFVEFIKNKLKELSSLDEQMPRNYLMEILENPN